MSFSGWAGGPSSDKRKPSESNYWPFHLLSPPEFVAVISPNKIKKNCNCGREKYVNWVLPHFCVLSAFVKFRSGQILMSYKSQLVNMGSLEINRRLSLIEDINGLFGDEN